MIRRVLTGVLASRIAVFSLIAALAFAAALAGAGLDGGGCNVVYAQTTVDYDDDDDGLIAVRTLAQLNAIRWDLDGQGD